MAAQPRTNGNAQVLHAPEPGTYVEPPVDIYETDKGYVLLADLPGVKADGLDIHVEADRLTIRGRVTAGEQRTYAYREFVPRDYYRTFVLADEIDPEGIGATLKDGVLRLELPKSARTRARQVPVRVE